MINLKSELISKAEKSSKYEKKATFDDNVLAHLEYKNSETIKNKICNLDSDSQTKSTFSDTQKGSKKISKFSINYVTNDSFLHSVNLDALEIHPINLNIYSADELRVKSIAENIKEHSLIHRIIINRNHQILSGNLRYKALKLLDVNTIEVYVIEIDIKDELEFIISSNHQREKTIIEAKNEIQYLFEKYSPGQGSRRTKEEGVNTVKKIAEITGYSKNKVSTIRKIDFIFPGLLLDVEIGNLTLNGANNKCEKIIALRNIGKEIDKDLISNLSVDKIDHSFSKSMKSYCKDSHPEYYAMINKGEMTSEDAYKKIFKDKKDTISDVDSNSGSGHTGFVDDSLICPCCSQKVRKKEEIEWIRKWEQQITEYVVNLKF